MLGRCIPYATIFYKFLRRLYEGVVVNLECSLKRISSKFFVVETKRLVGISVHVILMQQTCGQRSSRATESKRRVIENYFSERICYMFPISKYRGDRDLGLCTTSGLAFGEPQRHGKPRFFLRQNTFFFRILPLR